MAKYASLSDVTDTSVGVLEEDLLSADVFIDSVLKNSGIDPTSITLPNDFLKELAVIYATYRACIREARGEDSIYLEKAKFYKELLDEKLSMLSPKTLGVESASSPISAKLGRA